MPTPRTGAYIGLQSFDAPQQQAIKLLYDRLAGVEQKITALQAQVSAIPALVPSTLATKQDVQQQVANLKAEILLLLP